MADAIKVSVDMQDLKVLNDYLNTTEDKIDMTAKTAKKSFDQLKMAIDPAYRATKIFKDQVLVAQKAVATGAATQREYATAFAQIQKQAALAGVTINQFGQVADVNTRRLKRFGAVGMQQVGYQVQDFAVQVQGGTNMLVALGQQGSQLLGIFGPKGAIAGMILAIGTGLAGAFLAAKAATDKTEDATKLYKDALDELKSSTASLTLENYMLANSYKTVEIAAAKRAIAALKEARGKAAEKRRADIAADPMLADAGIEVDPNKIRTQYGGLYGPTYGDAIDTLNKAIAEAESQLIIKESFEAKKTAQEQLEFATKLKEANIDRAMTAMMSANASREELFILKQANEAEALRKKLRDEGLDVSKGQAKAAIDALESAHQLELTEFRRLEAIKAADEADRAAKKALADKNKQDAKNLQDLIEKYKQYQGLVNDISRSVESGLMSIAERTKTVEEAFRDMAADIIRQLYRVLVVQQMVGSFNAAEPEKSSGLAGFLGGMFKPRAKGGPVTAGQPYLVGERGPELFVPSSNGGVVANDKMGGGVTVVQNLNISTGVSQTVRAEIRNLMPQIAETAKSAVVDSKRRGGNYGKAFA